MYCAPATTRPGTKEISGPVLTVTVLFTDVPHTLAALRQAAGLGSSLHASIRILMPIVVPYPLGLSESPVDSRILHRRLTTVAKGVGIPTWINVVYCRDREETIEKCLDPHSIVVVCWRKRWLFNTTGRLAKQLTMLGHHVIAAETAKGD
jgi:hypothetical protein